VKKYLPDILLLALGLLVMALLVYVIAASDGWVCLLGILALAVVWIGWYRHLLNLAFRSLGVDPDDEDDLPSFPG
jgi:ABC-type antimicrobial peptide transport system permease subunit